MKKKWLWITLVFSLITTTVNLQAVNAGAPYEGYNYNDWREATPSPNAYLPSKVVEGTHLGVGPLKNPEDIYITKDNKIFILDSGNGRIISLDENWKLIREIKGFENGAKQDGFNKPEGIFVTEEGNIYVADTENRRIVELEEDGTFVREINEPKSDVIREGFAFFPRKIALDKAKRIYVIGRGVFDGIMEFDNDGTFNSFIGANKVRFNPIDYFWKTISTKAQREKMELFVPIEFNNLDLDSEGFIYTTASGRSSSTPIQRLNPTGTDILRQEGYFPVRGDLEFSMTSDTFSGFTVFVDIDVNEYGVYTAVDSKRGRIFSYDEDGNLLYIFGFRGKQAGTFKTPVAVERWNDQLVILDRDYHRITLFETTEFGSNVNDAVRLHNLGKEEESAQAWKQVLKLNSNYDIAYIGIGKAQLRQEQNGEAMEQFQLGVSRKYFSKAFQRYRKEVMRDQFGTVMTGLILLILMVWGFRIYRRNRKARLNLNASSD